MTSTADRRFELDRIEGEPHPQYKWTLCRYEGIGANRRFTKESESEGFFGTEEGARADIEKRKAEDESLANIPVIRMYPTTEGDA